MNMIITKNNKTQSSSLSYILLNSSQHCLGKRKSQNFGGYSECTMTAETQTPVL